MPIFEFNKPETFQPAIDKAWIDLSKLEPMQITENGLVEYNQATETFKIPVLGGEYLVKIPAKKLTHPVLIDEHIRGAMTVLVLHYLINCKPISLRNKLISYRELPGGMVFYNAFRSIAINPIARKFDNDLAAFGERALELAGRKVDHGEIAFEFKIFPRIPVTYLLWAGDEEVPASANILFDGSAQEQLHTEDLAEAGEVITHQLIL